MTAVDVLATLAYHATGLRTAPRLTVKQAERVSDELHAAWAAVAELVEGRQRDLEVFERAAANLDQAARLETAKKRRTFYRTAQEMCTDRAEAIRAALARVQGGGA